ncbi:Methyltransferase domain-containing protein [Cognatiyoonia sediminum]|uniref:Methyltransferase domain-containing protein n=1 Tax=Cognatiyoonia sediminum TaxID=1508389 RepID=A0A1M5QU03_9RHOB|nr:class I SAM-dependent methyltransferase [Cognatiyoonia sediminum]SHH17575.1 Methyltransferase domain-containing protein [Cognatiyoonia sediminum]
MTQDMTKEERRARQARQREKKDALRRDMLKKMPKEAVCVEIGVWKGEFSTILVEELRPKHLYLIDPWAVQDDAAGGASLAGAQDKARMDRIHDHVAEKFAQQIASGSVSILRDFSVPALATFDGGAIDFAYVDGDHTYEGVLSDLEALHPKLKVGGVVMMDDYHQRGWWGDGVIRALNTFVGRLPAHYRFKMMAGAQIAVSKLKD